MDNRDVKIKVFYFANGEMMTEHAIVEKFKFLIGAPLVPISGRHDAGTIGAVENAGSDTDGVLYLYIRVDFADGDSQWQWLRAPRVTEGKLTAIDNNTTGG